MRQLIGGCSRFYIEGTSAYLFLANGSFSKELICSVLELLPSEITDIVLEYTNDNNKLNLLSRKTLNCMNIIKVSNKKYIVQI